jgi:hypothetical protein
MNAENMNVNSASSFFRMVAIGGPSRILIGIFAILKKVKNSKEKQRTYGVPLPWKPCGLRRFTR